MISDVRKSFNSAFTANKYQDLLNYVETAWGAKQNFRIAESPVFIDRSVSNQLFEACELITDKIVDPSFSKKMDKAIPPGQYVPNESDQTLFLQMDFGLCTDLSTGNIIPQLIEVQGFPSLYFFQFLVAKAYRDVYNIPSHLKSIFYGSSDHDYLELLRKNIVGSSQPENVILLEIDPQHQVTNIDFIGANKLFGIPTKCVTDIHRDGKSMYYKDGNGKKIGVEKIFNRVIFDELLKRNDLKRNFSFADEIDAEWIGHPNWFFKISKYSLPLFKNKYVPDTFYLNQLESYPDDLENYVLKPLYSFSGMGVELHVNRGKLDQIADPQNWILQRKVEYSPLIATPSGPAKCEVRMLMIWEKGKSRPVIVNNLARLSKGAMVGVRYNKDKDWVGGSVGFFDRG